MFKLKKNKFKNLDLVDRSKIKEAHEELLNDFNEEKAINVFYSIVYYKLNIKLNRPQIIAAKEICKGSIIEMATGEGKTLTIMLSAYLNYLKGEKTVITTANNYLVKRDSDQFNDLMSELKISSRYILGIERQLVKVKIYENEIIYTTIANLAFDVLRDEYRMNLMIKDYQNIILDEADLTLIDYANSPINIVSSEDFFPVNLFLVDRMFEKFNDNDYVINNKNKTVNLTEEGYSKVEDICLENEWVKNRNDFYSSKFSNIVEQFKNMITANKILKINEDYSIRGGKVRIINKSTGRIENDSNFGSGLQQAVEVLNKLEPSKSNHVKTMITIRTLLKRFNKLSGLTGTIYDDKKEIERFYGVEVLRMETNVPVKRYDAPDLFFTERKYKVDYLVKKIKELNDREIPVLVGTLNIQDTLEIRDRLINENLKVNILTSENEEDESEIIKNAGRRSAITISTKIAGRGTDIILGGEKESYESYEEWRKEHDYIDNLGGLFVIGFERSRQRRIDNQLKGRSGRQGDNGVSLFLVSLDDDILSNFNNNGSKKIFEMLNIVDRPVESKMNSKMVKINQKNIENSYYDGRLEVARFDEENDEYRSIIREIKIHLKEYGAINYLNKLINEQIQSKIESSLLNYTDLNFNLGTQKIELSYGEISKMDIDELIDWIRANKINTSFMGSEYFNSYFHQFYFDQLNELWESMVRFIPAIKKQSKMLKMLQRIEISEYADMLESKFKNLYHEINQRSINYAFDNIEFDKYVTEQENKKILKDNLDGGITSGYVEILGVGV